jgi:hypothetical protein
MGKFYLTTPPPPPGAPPMAYTGMQLLDDIQ